MVSPVSFFVLFYGFRSCRSPRRLHIICVIDGIATCGNQRTRELWAWYVNFGYNSRWQDCARGFGSAKIVFVALVPLDQNRLFLKVQSFSSESNPKKYFLPYHALILYRFAQCGTKVQGLIPFRCHTTLGTRYILWGGLNTLRMGLRFLSKRFLLRHYTPSILWHD